jgi:hypothetical protein
MVAMDPMTGRTGLASLRQNEHGPQVYLQLPPGHSIVLRTFPDRVADGQAWAYLSPVGQPVTIHGPWQVTFIEGGPALPHSFATPAPVSWTQDADPEAQRFAGTAVYRTTFDTPAGAGPWLLDLGRVCHSARVRLHGQDLETLIMSPYRLTVGHLEPAGNVLEVEVTNLSANRIRDLDRRKVDWKIFHDINFVNINYQPFDASGWPLFDSGLLGPVTLVSQAPGSAGGSPAI